MPRFFTCGLLIVCLALTACNSTDEKPAAKQTATAEEVTTPKAPAVTEPVHQAEAKLADPAKNDIDGVAPVIAVANEATALAEEKVQKIEETVSETVTSAADTATETVAAVTEEPPAEVPAAASAEGDKIMENSYGTVILSHAKHARTIKCAVCHGDEESGYPVMNKARAHELCKGCHKAEGAGPTGCKDCHQKD